MQGTRRSGQRGRRLRADETATSGLVLLLADAAGTVVALPATEICEVRAALPAAEAARDGWVDLGVQWSGTPSAGPWLHWVRGARHRWLRVERLVGVVTCALRDLAPLPPWLTRAAACPFWAAGVHDDEVFLLFDPACLEPPGAWPDV